MRLDLLTPRTITAPAGRTRNKSYGPTLVGIKEDSSCSVRIMGFRLDFEHDGMFGQSELEPAQSVVYDYETAYVSLSLCLF